MHKNASRSAHTVRDEPRAHTMFKREMPKFARTFAHGAGLSGCLVPCWPMPFHAHAVPCPRRSMPTPSSARPCYCMLVRSWQDGPPSALAGPSHGICRALAAYRFPSLLAPFLAFSSHSSASLRNSSKAYKGVSCEHSALSPSHWWEFTGALSQREIIWCK